MGGIMGSSDLDGMMSQNERRSDETPKRAADDVAADMQRRLSTLGDHVADARRKVRAIDPDPAARLAGDATAAPQGPRSHGATLRATTHRDEDH